MILCILDGWGIAPTWRGNAITFASPPNFQRLWREYPHLALATSAPGAQRDRRLIDSELQHATIGSGRWILSDYEEITQAIDQGLLQDNPILTEAMAAAVQKQRPLHLIGVASLDSVETDIRHLAALLTLAKKRGVTDVPIHLIVSDGRSRQTNGAHAVRRIQELLDEQQIGWIASVIGRGYGLDTHRQWSKTLRAYRLWTLGEGMTTRDPLGEIERQYARGVTDQTLGPIRVIRDGRAAQVENRDVVIVWHGAAAQIQQLVRAFVDPAALRPFLRRQAPLRALTKFVTLVSPSVAKNLPVDAVFPPANIPTTLAEIIAGRGLQQLRVGSERKKAALTSYFSGGRTIPYPGEERILIDEVRGQTSSSLTRELDQLIDRTFRALASTKYNCVVMNFDQVDRAAHTHDLFLTASAVRAVDAALGRLAQATLALNGTLLVTADHGNAEEMVQGSRDPVVHTTNPVPLMVIAPGAERNLMQQAIAMPANLIASVAQLQANLTDLAPTILALLDIPTPVEMVGRSLVDQLGMDNDERT